MRNLFLALVLVNLAFAAWSAWLAPADRVGRPADDGLPALTLVSEVPVDLRSSGVVVEQEGAAQDLAAPPADILTPPVVTNADADADFADPNVVAAEPAGDEALAAVEPIAAEAIAHCTSVGPFRELSQAATAAATLRAAGYQPLQRVGEGEVWIGYWVYIPAIASEGEANEILAKVRAEGIADSYVIPNSDSGNLVSLGVFSEISGVSRRRDQVRALGFEPEVVDRTRRATVYWVDVTLAAGQALDFDTLQPPGRILRLEQRACEAPG
jgi:cell division septation protein DedD